MSAFLSIAYVLKIEQVEGHFLICTCQSLISSCPTDLDAASIPLTDYTVCPENSEAVNLSLNQIASFFLRMHVLHALLIIFLNE